MIMNTSVAVKFEKATLEIRHSGLDVSR